MKRKLPERKAKKMSKATVIGAGLAGVEAAWQLAKAGIETELWEIFAFFKLPQSANAPSFIIVQGVPRMTFIILSH